jgi:hypothetical protein
MKETKRGKGLAVIGDVYSVWVSGGVVTPPGRNNDPRCVDGWQGIFRFN